jgi:peroxiredoxin
MKKIILIALSAFVMSCNGIIGNGFKISGEIKGLADGTNVFLEKQDPKTGVVAVDTVKIKGGKFTFEGKAEEPEIHSIRFDKTQGGFIVVVEKGNINAVINKDSIQLAKVTGTFNNDELIKYNAEMMKIQKRMMAFQNTNMPVMQAAQQKKDTVAINKLRKEYSKFQEEFTTSNYKYIEANPKSFLSVLLVEGMFNDPQPKLDKIKKYYDSLDAEVKGTKPGKNIATKLKEVKSVEIGQKAPDFSAPNAEGKMVSLKESLGKVTIIDFWASWCAPCRQENPNVVALYNEFHAKGLNIIGVSLDKAEEAAKWKEAIAKDKLTWTQVSNLKFWEDPIAMKYNIKSIPATFLLDANGNIVAKDLRGAELKAKVAELLAK